LFIVKSMIRLELIEVTPTNILGAVQIRKDTVLAAMAILATLIVALALSTRSLTGTLYDAREETRKRAQLRLSTQICGSLSVTLGLLHLAGLVAASSSNSGDISDALLIMCLSQTLAYVASTFRLSASEQLSAVQDQLPELLSKHRRATAESVHRWDFTPRDSIPVSKLLMSLTAAALALIGFVAAMNAIARSVLGVFQTRYVELFVQLWLLLLMLVLLACVIGVLLLLPQQRYRLSAVIMTVPLCASIALQTSLAILMIRSDDYAGTEQTSVLIVAVLIATSLCSCLIVLPLALTRYAKSPTLKSAYIKFCYPAHILRFAVLANERNRRRQEIHRSHRRTRILAALELPEQISDTAME